ncbi:hypothetical protein RRG08_012034 [Elysia crispata]|uniref:Uncharacterized protein n=1 Tax=Elysia crispata TaxID=231223 RepID=A0AAE1CNB8_9GAST|nr:hypothetical protein RRG08_012034 [Elysia crispata]
MRTKDIFYGAGHLRLTTSRSTLPALLLWNIRTFSMERDTYVSQPAADAGCSTALEYPDIFYGAGHLRLTTSSSTLHALLLWNIRTFSLERDTYVSQPAADAGCSTALEYQDIFCGAGHLRLATSRRRWLLYCSGISGHFLWSGTPTSRNQPLDAACSTALEYQDIFYRAGHLRLTTSSSTLHALLLWNIRTFSLERDTYVSQPAADAGCSTALEYQDIFYRAGHLRLATSRRRWLLYCSGISGHFLSSGTPTSHNQQLDTACSTALEYQDIFLGAGHLRLATSRRRWLLYCSGISGHFLWSGTPTSRNQPPTLAALLLWNIRTFSVERDTYVSQPAADAGCSTALEYQDIFCGAGHLRLATSRRRWLLYCSGISGHFLWSGTPTSRNQPPTLAALLLWNIRTFSMERDTYVSQPAARRCLLNCSGISGHFLSSGTPTSRNQPPTLASRLLWNIRTFSIERDTYVSQPAARHCMLYCSGISGHFPWSGTPTSRNQPPTLAALLLWNIRTFSVERDTYVSQPAADAGCSTALEYQDIFYGAGHLRLATSRLTLPAQLLWNIRTFSMERDTYVSQPAADAGCSTALEYQDIFCGAGHLRLATSRRRWLLYCSGISGHFLWSGTPTSRNQPPTLAALLLWNIRTFSIERDTYVSQPAADAGFSTALEYQDIFYRAGHLRLTTSSSTLPAQLLWNIRTFSLERDTYVSQPAADAGCSTALEYQDIFYGAGHLRLATSRRRWLLYCSGISGHFLSSGTPASHNQQLDTACSTALEYQDIFLGAGHLRLATSRRRWLLYCSGISGHFLSSGTPTSRNQPPTLASLLLWNIRTFSIERDTYVSQPAARHCMLYCSGISGHFLWSGTPTSRNQPPTLAALLLWNIRTFSMERDTYVSQPAARRCLLYCSGISGHFLSSGTPTSRNQPPTLASLLLWNIRTFSMERDTYVSQPAADAGCSTALEYQDIFYGAGHLRLTTSRSTIMVLVQYTKTFI